MIRTCRSILAALLIGALMTAFLPASPVFAEEAFCDSPFSSDSEEALPRYAPEDRVPIIIELEEAPLLEAYDTAELMSVSDYLESREAQSLEKQIQQEQKQLIRRLNSSDLDLEVEYQYSAVLNGIAVEANYGDLETIRSMKGVQHAFVANYYTLPDEHLRLIDSTKMMGIDRINGTDYTGKGSVVAILDTGLNSTTQEMAFTGGISNPRYAKEDIAQILKEKRLTMGTLSVDVLYKSEKIPFAYDYAGGDYNVSGGNAHGTHVAGIVGANQGDYIGVAPDAQLMILKVFADGSGGAYDNDILAALDDAVKLGADTINMSLGSNAGFTQDSSATVRNAYNRVAEAGISLMAAAGNAYSSGYNGASGNDLLFTSHPDNSTVGSPSTYSMAMSVASVNNTSAISPYFLAGDRKIRYDDSAESSDQKSLTALSGDYEYVDCGLGAEADFQGKDLTGRIALIQRGGEENGSPLTFTQKEANAKKAGAAAAIIYDHSDGELVSMATTHAIPCVSISKADGEAMIASSEKTVTIHRDFLGTFTDGTSGKMSDFSSWGVTPDLKLKPEITAPGGNIYSTLPEGKYGSMSGTSMAAPHASGASAVVLQYINATLDGLNRSAAERTDLAHALLMSTAEPVLDENGNPFSPRKQGAGEIRLDRATTTPVYLLAADGGRPAVSMGDNSEGRFSFAFQGVNLTETAAEYTVSVAVQTETVLTEDGQDYIGEKARMLGNDMVQVTAPQTLTVPASGTVTPTVSLSLTEKGKSELLQQFPSGIFIEGFVTLTPKAEGVPLSLPFVGFYGDWYGIPIFDASAYGDEPADVVEMALYQFDTGGGGHELGTIQYGDSDRHEAQWIAIRGGEKNKEVTAACALLRNVDRLTYQVTNDQGEVVYMNTERNVSKSYYEEQSFHTPMDSKGWTAFDEWNSPLPDGNYTYTVTAEAGGQSQSVSFPIVIDSEKPRVLSSRVEGNTWKVTVQDNHYIQAVCATLGSTPLTGYICPDQSAPGEAVTVSFDLTDTAFTGLTSAKVAVADFADNQFVSESFDLTKKTDPETPAVPKVEASVYGPSSVIAGEPLPFALKLQHLNRVATVSFVFEKDADLTLDGASGKNGFTLIDGIHWKEDGSGTAMLSYLEDGAGGSLTTEDLTQVAELIFRTARDSGKLGLTLKEVAISGYDEKGTAVWIDSTIGTSRADITVTEAPAEPDYDVNRDGVVDQLDITCCQLYYQARTGDGNWEKALVCDVDQSGKIDIQDMILILQHIQ